MEFFFCFAVSLSKSEAKLTDKSFGIGFRFWVRIIET